MKFKPLHDRVLIEVLDGSEKTAALVESEGAFFDLKKRKVCSPPTEIIDAFKNIGLLNRG